jgi:hypothetical protein
LKEKERAEYCSESSKISANEEKREGKRYNIT